MVAVGETCLYYFKALRKAMNEARVQKTGDAPQIERPCRSEKMTHYTGKSIMHGGVAYYRDHILSEQNKCQKNAQQTTGMLGIRPFI